MLYSAVLGRQIKSGAPVIIVHIGSGRRFKQGEDGICMTPTASDMQGRVQIIISAIDIRAFNLSLSGVRWQ